MINLVNPWLSLKRVQQERYLPTLQWGKASHAIVLPYINPASIWPNNDKDRVNESK